jgi:hypothetical protein
MLELIESSVILFLPSRFVGASDGGDGSGIFWRRAPKKNGAQLLARVSERQTICVRKVGDNRAEQVKIRRFLSNERVTMSEMVMHQRGRVAAAAAGRHVLAIQDTSEINYQSQSGRKRGLGTVGNGTDVGLFVHPVLAVDAEKGYCLGLLDAQVWRRRKAKAKNYRQLPIEEKESYRWLTGAQRAKVALQAAAMVTVIDDREGDIYEKWARLPNRRTQLLTRACRDRAVDGGGQLFAAMAALPERHRYEIELPKRDKRPARRASLAVRFGPVTINRPITCSDPKAPPHVDLFAIEVCEIDPPANEKDPILWRLLTTHEVENVTQALTVIDWYRQRWHIEQLFRTLKTHGMGIEQSVVEDGDALEKLAVIALIGASITMQLVLARAAPDNDQPASHVFDDRQIKVIEALQPKLQGRTIKQKNPCKPSSLAWAAWTIARLGGWTGYESERSTGPITMHNGLQRFDSIAQGYFLNEDVCSS